MIAADLLGRLDGVRKTAKGWTGKCPAHADRTPSLSIREGERGLLVHCWAGCPPDEVCEALGLCVADLFYDDRVPGPRDQRSRSAPRPLTPREFLAGCELGVWRGAVAREFRGLATLDAARGLETSGWSDDDFDRAMAAVGRGYDDLRAAEHLHVLAFGLRERKHKGDVGGQHRAA